jgi:hypothetical protein
MQYAVVSTRKQTPIYVWASFCFINAIETEPVPREHKTLILEMREPIIFLPDKSLPQVPSLQFDLHAYAYRREINPVPMQAEQEQNKTTVE